MIYQLSPMESVSCWAFRALHTTLGADRTYTEMIRCKALARNNKAAWSLIDTFGSENCHVQLMAVKPVEIEKFFALLEEKKKLPEYAHLKNIKGFNLNLGCPSPDIIKEGGGAALLKRPQRVCDLITTLAKYTELPISVKIRLGLNQHELEQRIFVKLLDALSALEVSNFKEIIVHLKHARQTSASASHYDLIPLIKKHWKQHLTLNGGYSDTHLPSDCYGVMFARASYKDALLFAKITGKEVTTAFVKKKWKELLEKHPPKQKYLDYLEQKQFLI